MGNMARMNKLVINEEGFIDLRRNPPATRVQVQGGIEPPEPQPAVDVVVEPPAPPPTEPLPARQQDTTMLALPVAPPVAVPVSKAPVKLCRIDSVEGPPCYAVMGKQQFERLNKWKWMGTRSGHMARIVTSATGTKTVVWLHREAARCNRADRFVGFLDGDERNLTWANLKVCASKEEAKAIRRDALARSANG